jgi:hypothetical protein
LMAHLCALLPRLQGRWSDRGVVESTRFHSGDTKKNKVYFCAAGTRAQQARRQEGIPQRRHKEEQNLFWRHGRERAAGKKAGGAACHCGAGSGFRCGAGLGFRVNQEEGGREGGREVRGREGGEREGGSEKQRMAGAA